MLRLEDGEDVRAIVTPDLRLIFRWSGDRWSHAIDIRPGPWQTVASADEWEENDGLGASRPTYQQLHLQREEDAALALAVGQAGDHHYSASFRVTYRAWRQPHFRDPSILQDRSKSLVNIDVADRCHSPAEPPEARYRIHTPPAHTHLGDDDDYASSNSGWSNKWRSILVWEADVRNNYDVTLFCPGETPTARVSILERDESGWSVRVAPTILESTKTCRFEYAWEHHRVSVFRKESEDDLSRPWTMTMEPGVDPPGWAYRPDRTRDESF